MSAPHFHRIAPGDYETANGRYRLYRLIGASPPAWNVLELTVWEGVEYDRLVVDGAASMRDALELLQHELAGRTRLIPPSATFPQTRPVGTLERRGLQDASNGLHPVFPNNREYMAGYTGRTP